MPFATNIFETSAKYQKLALPPSHASLMGRLKFKMIRFPLYQERLYHKVGARFNPTQYLTNS